MEDLSSKIEQVLASVATYSSASQELSAKIGSRRVVARLKDESLQEVEFSAHQLLGVGDDPEKVIALLKKSGIDAAHVDIIGAPPPHKEILGWCETLSLSFTKAWVSKQDHTLFVEKLCCCGEGFLKNHQYDLAFSEIYDRFADRMVSLREGIVNGSDDIKSVIPKVAVCIRFTLGRCLGLYQRSVLRDDVAKRKDTIECLRDVLKDIMAAVKFLNSQDESVREELYWAMYNACVLAKRIARWLRLHGFGSAALPAIRWLSKAKNTCLPLMNMHHLPFRMRFYMELIYCAESAQHLGEASHDCAAAIEQIGELSKLETMAEPVPKETKDMLDTMMARFKMLKVKYDFWLGTVPDVKAALGQDAASCAVPCLLETFHIQHGLRWHFGSAPESAEEMPEKSTDGGPEVTKFTYQQVDAKQRDLLAAILTEVKPHMEKVVAITDLLEDFTRRRLEFEHDKDARASGDDFTAVDENGEEIPPKEDPAKPDDEQLTAMGMNCNTNMHTIEDVFPLSVHVAVARECLRQEMRGLDAKLQGEFELLKKSLSLRLRYRHFLRPPLVSVDVKETALANRDEVELPDGFEFLSEDLNVYSLRNRKLEADEAKEKAAQEAILTKNPVLKKVQRERPQPKHAFLIGERYDAWKHWTTDQPVALKRICNLRVEFSNQPPQDTSGGKGKSKRGQDKAASSAKGKGAGGPWRENETAKSFGFFDPAPLSSNQSVTPWMHPYHTSSASDNSGFDHVGESKQLRESMLQELRAGGHLHHRHLKLQLEPHPGSDQEVMPYLTYSIYDERSLWSKDEKAQAAFMKASEEKAQALARKQEEQGSGNDMQGEPDGQNVAADDFIFPTCCSLLDKADLVADPIQDITVISSKYLHAEAKLPSKHFNAMIRVDLRQTPAELMGLPLQNYFYMCSAIDTPCTVFVTKQLRLMHAFHNLHNSMASAGDDPTVNDAGDYQRPQVITRLLELSDCFDALLDGKDGRLFLLDAADMLEDVSNFVFLKLAWPKLQFIQERREKHELYERMLTEHDERFLSDWSLALRRILPVLLRTLENVHAVDGLTLASAAFGLARLLMQEHDSRSASVELGMAIVRLENELSSSSCLGPHPQLDRPSASAVSFDPPSVRPPTFALYEDDAMDDSPDDADKVLLLGRQSRLEQERICLLTQLYEQWIDCCLKVHFKNVTSTVRRVRKPGEVVNDDLNGLVIETNSTKLALSNQEAEIIAKLGENPYLRSLFFATVARRRPEVATTALGKACSEVELAASQEQQLWIFCEKELIRQQKVLRNPNSIFCEEFMRKAKQKDPNVKPSKPRAHPPMLFGRSPRCIRLRTAPLPTGSHPPVHPAACELAPAGLEYKEAHHSQQLGIRENTKAVLACTILGKEFGAGTPVAETHKALPGTAIRLAGNEFIEIAGLKPNTNYSFASLYYEGFEATRSVASTISESSPPIGTYHPLPLVLLRISICKESIRAGLTSTPVWTRAWPPLFEQMCERTHASEEFDTCGLRTFKLRLDVADRMPPVILSAFAKIILLKNRQNAVGQSDKFPATRPMQQSVLRSANECLIAVDCASRSGNGLVTVQAVSYTLRIVVHLLRYRTKPPMLLGLLTKCAACLEVLKLPKHHLAWYSQARIMTTYLFHNIAVLSVQLGQPALLAKQVDGDDAQHYVADARVDPKQREAACAHILDAAMELAFLGDVGWPRGEGKAKAAFDGQANAEELLRCLKELSARNYSAVAKDSAALALAADETKRPNALSFMQSSVMRAWQSGGVDDILTDTFSKHPSNEVLAQMLELMRKRFVDHGFMLRAAPPQRVELPPEQKEDATRTPEEGAEETIQESTEAKKDEEEETQEAVPVGPTVEELMTELSSHGDATYLAQLELAKAAPLLQELCNSQFHWHDISRFKFLDLSQTLVPKLPDEAAVGKGLEMTETGEIEVDTGENEENGEWAKKDADNKAKRSQAFDTFKKLLPPLVHASAYASVKRADLVLQAAVVSVLNALYIVGPAPEECVPAGVKSNPEDNDADAYEIASKTENEGETEQPPAEEKPPADDNDTWLNLVLIADFAVDSLTRLKQENAMAQNGPTPRDAGKVDAEEIQADDEEARVVREAKTVSKAIESADEEVQDHWFERRPDLDVASFAKLVTFAALCLYHMRRWDKVVKLCWNFNDATCSAFAASVLPLAIGAQSELCGLSKKAIGRTRDYMAQCEKDKQEPPNEKLDEHRKAYYEDILLRQNKLDKSWEVLLKAVEASHSLVTRAVPAAIEMLRNSRILLSNFLEEKQEFNLQVNRGNLSDGQKKGSERALRLAAAALVSSYRKSAELLRKRQMSDLLVQALHELGNIQWLEGDAGGAQSSWSDAVDVAFQYVYAIKNWQACLESNVKPPQDRARAEGMMLSVVILSKQSRLTAPGHATAHLHAALFASGIIETVLTSALPHPSHRILFALNKYRMRELFFGLRESEMLLPPNCLHGGLDGLAFLGSLAFFYNTFMVTGYQVARCVPICALYNYIATDICRNTMLAIKGRLMMARALLHCRELQSTWLILFSIAKCHDLPRSVFTSEYMDKLIVQVQERLGAEPYRNHEEPFTDVNKQAVNTLAEFAIAAVNGVDATEALGLYNVSLFQFLQIEFLVTVSSYGRVFSKLADPEEKDRKDWLDKADQRLTQLWSKLTGKDDDVVAWSTAHASSKEKGTEAVPMAEPTRRLSEEESQLCVDIRILRARISEFRGDLGRAVIEILYAMNFLQLLAQQDENSRKHPDMKTWMALRRHMVQLLVAQGRHSAAEAHIEMGLKECKEKKIESSQVGDDLSRVELLAARARIEVLSGKLLEVRGAPPKEVQSGALVSVEQCLATASKSLPTPTQSAISARMMLSVVLGQNFALAKIFMDGGVQAVAKGSSSSAVAQTSKNKKGDADDDIEAQQRVLMSPIAKALQAKGREPTTLIEYLSRQEYLIKMIAQCLEDLDKLLSIQGFELHPHNRNILSTIGESDAVPEYPQLPFLPPLRRKLCQMTDSDSRDPPSVYFELLPIRCNYELLLIKLCLDIGNFSEARRFLSHTKEDVNALDDYEVCRRLLKEAETRTARCLHLMPWLHVQLSLLKLRWRRLDLRIGVASKAIVPPRTNYVIYRDPKTFASGTCPPTTSPIYRTFIQRAKATPLTDDTEWVLAGQVDAEGSLERFLQELVVVARVSVLEGGHDYAHLRGLFHEGIEEVVRSCKAKGASPLFDILCALFTCVVGVADTRRAFQFELAEAPPAKVEETKGGKPPAAVAAAPPPNIDCGLLPQRVAIDLQAHLKRQSHEGALAYSAAAQTDFKKSLQFAAVIKHGLALRRQCDAFASIYQTDRILCDQLHVAMTHASEQHYKKEKVLSEVLLQAIEAPPPAPTTGDMMIEWVPADPPLDCPPSDACVLIAFICPLGENDESATPILARSPVLQRTSVRETFSTLRNDLDHCKPAATVAGAFLAQRLRKLARTLRGIVIANIFEAPPEELEAEFEAALLQLLLSLQDESVEPPVVPEVESPPPLEIPELLSAAKVQRLLKAITSILDVNNHAARVLYPEFSCFMRKLLAPLKVF